MRRGRSPRGAGARGAAAWSARAAHKPTARSQSMTVRPIPEASPILTPQLVVSDAAGAIELYARGFGARETFRTMAPDNRRIMFAELLIGEARIFVLDEFPEQNALSPTTLGGTPVALHLYVARVD